MSLSMEKTLAIAIDLQERLVPVMHDVDFLIQRAEILTKGLYTLGVPLFVTRQYPKGLGDTIAPIAAASTDAALFDKIDYSIYKDAGVQKALEESTYDTIVLYGVEAHICVLQSAIDLKKAGYDVYVVTDACASRHTYDRDMAWRRLEQNGIVLTTVESLLFEFLERAGTDTFKAISKLIK